MVFRSAWSVMMSAGLALAAGACGAYPDRVFPSADASVGTGGTGGAVGAGGSAATGGASGSSAGTGGGDASLVSDAAKDTSSPIDAKADVDRQICKTAGVHTGLDCRCADGTVDDEFNMHLVGCADSPDFGTTWAMRLSACGPSCTVATPLQWVSMPGHGNMKPRFNYWLDDDLQLTSGTMSGACAVNRLPTPMGEPCAGQPMHVCVPSLNGGQVVDPVGGTCDLHDCGFETQMPNNYLGGCARNRTAGTLCYCP